MATSGEQTALGQLDQEATCPLCLDLFERPMSLSCGHNFCRDCLAHLGARFSCPQCRAKVELSSASPNRPLANIACHLKKLRLSEGGQEESDRQLLCREHGQPLQTFCSREKSLLCPGCLRGHQGHRHFSLPEAARGYKDLLDGLLEPLRKEGQKLLEQRQAEEQSRQECQEQIAAEKQKLLAWLAEQEEKMEAEWGVALAQLSGEAFCLQQLMAQTERKCCQPDGEFLQDIQDTVDRCRNYVVRRVERVSPRLQGRVRTLLEKSSSVRQAVDNQKASLQTTLTREHLERLPATAAAPEKPRSEVFITLDRSTAHSRLRCQSVSCSCGNYHCPDGPERFDEELCVLGREGFTTGCHWWDVSIDEPPDSDNDLLPVCGTARWAVGVAKESVRRKGSFPLSPQEGIWAVGNNLMGEMVAFSNPPKPVSFPGFLGILRVRLNYEAEKVEFLSAENDASIYTFRTGPLRGETLRPFLCLGQAGVTLHCAEFPVESYLAVLDKNMVD